MKVLHVSPYLAPALRYGGPPRSVLGLARGLQEAGVDVEVFTTTANGDADLDPACYAVHERPGLRVRAFPRSRPRRWFASAGLRRALLGRGWDIVHVHGLWNLPAWTAVRRSRRLGVAYVVSPRGMLDEGSLAHHALRKKIAYRWLEHGHLAGAAFLHATSAAEGESIRRRGLEVPVMVLPNGVESARDPGFPRGTFRRELGLGDDAPLLVFLGRLHPLKRLDLLAAALPIVLGGRPAARLVVAGPDEGGHGREIRRAFEPVADAVHWVGELGEERKQALLQDADVLVQCSDSESFGMSVAEALAAGVPAVVTRSCPWPDIETARCGRWVAQAPAAIAQGVLDVLADRTEARAMGERGRELVRASYTWNAVGRAMARCYERALGG